MATYTIPLNHTQKLEVMLLDGPFNRVTELNAKGFKLISARDLALTRSAENPAGRLSRQWAYVAETLNYFPNGEILVASRKHSPILKSLDEAMNCHRKHAEFYLPANVTSDLRQHAEKDPLKAIVSGVLLINPDEIPCPESEWRQNAYLKFLFQDAAEFYEKFLSENYSYQMPIRFAQKEKPRGFEKIINGILAKIKRPRAEKPAFCMPLVIDSIGQDSALIGNRRLTDSGGVAGVRIVDADSHETALDQNYLHN
jgi:hypothetical protein